MPTENGSSRGAERPSSGADKPSGGLVVERITHQDVPAVCALLKHVWEGESGLPSELAKSWQPTPLEFTSRMEGITYFAGRRDGRIVGVVGGEIVHGACRLVQIAVDPGSRRQGVALALVTAALDWAKRSNVSSVWVEPLARFSAAGPLLARLGFAHSGTLHHHEWNEDIQLFEKVF